MSLQPVYYSPTDLPIAKPIWDVATTTVGNSWIDTTWKVAKFVLLLLPLVAATVLDATVFNLARCSVGNLATFIKYKYFPPEDTSWSHHFKVYWKEYVGVATAVTAFGFSFYYGTKLWNRCEQWMIAKLSTEEMASRTPSLGLTDVIAEHIGNGGSSVFSWVDHKIGQWPSYLLSHVQSKVQWGLTPFVAFDNATQGWLSYLFPKGPLFSLGIAIPSIVEKAIASADPTAPRLFPDAYYRMHRKVSGFMNAWTSLVSFNFLFGSFLHAKDVSTGVAAFTKTFAERILFIGYYLTYFSVLGYGSYWIADRAQGVAHRILRAF